MFRKQILLAIIAVALAQSALTKQKPLPQEMEGVKGVEVERDGLGDGGWKTINTRLSLYGMSELLSFDSTNSRAEYRIFDFGNGGVCRVRAFIGSLFYNFDFQTQSQLSCSQAVIAQITQQGHVLFLDPSSGQYRYTTQSFSLTDVMNVQGSQSIAQVSAAGVQIAATKTDTSSRQNFDGFRIYSKASDSNSNYPLNFYYLASNAGRNSFVQSASSTLTLKTSNWVYKRTSNRANFQQIDSVNFVPVHGDRDFEGQFIMGRYYGQDTCLFGVVNTLKFFTGRSTFPQMYANPQNSQDFSCGNGANYQGILMNGPTPQFSYSINRNSGQMRVCSGLPQRIGSITSVNQLGNSCQIAANGALSLNGNEYYGAVDLTRIGGNTFGFVTIRVKDTGTRVRQVFVDFANSGNLPIFDTENYMYSVSGVNIFRLPKNWGAGATVYLDYFNPTSLMSKEK